MLEDLWKSIKIYIHERTTSPLLGSFLITWSLINFRFFVIFLGEAKAQEKLDLMQLYVFGVANSWLPLFVYPLISTATYIFIYPHVARWVYSWWHAQQNKLKEVRQKLDDAEPILREEETRMRANLRIAQQKSEQEIRELSKEIDSLREKLEKCQKFGVDSKEASPSSGVKLSTSSPDADSGKNLEAPVAPDFNEERTKSNQKVLVRAQTRDTKASREPAKDVLDESKGSDAAFENKILESLLESISGIEIEHLLRGENRRYKELILKRLIERRWVGHTTIYNKGAYVPGVIIKDEGLEECARRKLIPRPSNE